MNTAKVRIERLDTYTYAPLKAAVERIFDAFPMDLKGKNVVIKPNLLLARAPENASTTHPNVVRAVCEAVISRGGKALIAESGGGPINRMSLTHLYEVTGMTEAAEKSGAELNFNTESEKLAFPQGRTKKEFLVLKVIKDADLVISVAKLKTHGFMKMTGAVKNLFGVIPGLHKTLVHKDLPGKPEFASMICDLALAIKPVLTVTDAIVGMEGEGPSGGTPKKCGLLLASGDPFASDLAASAVMGIKPEEAPILREAIERKLIGNDPYKLEIEGEELRRVITPFSFPGNKKSIVGLLPGAIRYPIEDRLRAYPFITDRCASCGRCAGICPQKTIHKGKDHFHVDIEKCIRCYCCHEICPEKAIDMVRKGRYASYGKNH